MRTESLDGAALDVLRVLAQGKRVVANQKGAQALMQRGYVTRIGGTHLRITDTGRGFIAGVDHVLSAL